MGAIEETAIAGLVRLQIWTNIYELTNESVAHPGTSWMAGEFEGVVVCSYICVD